MGNTRVQSSDALLAIPADPSVPADGKVSLSLITGVYGILRSIITKINGRISSGDGVADEWTGNLDRQRLEFVTPAGANTEFVLLHGLDRVVTSYVKVGGDRAADLYDSNRGSWTDKHLSLKCSVASANLAIEVY